MGGETTNSRIVYRGEESKETSQSPNFLIIYFFATKALRHKVTRRFLIFFIPLSGNWGGHEFTNYLPRRSRENRVCAEIYEKDTAFARS